MNNPADVNDFDAIKSLCRDFRHRVKAGDAPHIEEYLPRVGEAARPNLFQNLLNLEVQFRNRQGETPSSNEYRQRFPQYAREIRQAFFESTLMSMDARVETPADVQTIQFGMPATRTLGEYELLRELGRGGFGVVYEARHRHRHDRVALKTLPVGLDGAAPAENHAERLHRFRREFRSLSDINHPNLVGMQSLEVDGNQWFFTMDLVEGIDFLEYVRPDDELNETRLRSTLAQLVQGITALHSQGIVHRDLKPANVMVDGDGHVVVLDFGLVAELQQRTDQTMSMQSRQFGGTPLFAAPEQFSGTRSMASDWYAVGVMLYQALTGDLPFRGTNVEILVAKQQEAAPTLTGRNGVPADLAGLIDRLLEKEPERRPSGEAIAKSLGIRVESARTDSTDSSLLASSGSSDLFLIGREPQLAELEHARRDLLERREPVAVFLRGKSGEGKTSLAEAFLTPLRRSHEVLVLSGRCYDRESVPFKAIDSVIDALMAYLRGRSADELQRLLPDDIPLLAHLFPVLCRVEAINDRATMSVSGGIDSRQIRYRAFAALRDLLSTIGQSTPVVLFIDDLQWGDADSAEVLHGLLQPPDPPAVMLLGSYRRDEAENSPFLQQWASRDSSNTSGAPVRNVDVGPLTEEQCLAFLTTRLGTSCDSLEAPARRLFADSQGNPYFLEQLLEGFNPATGEFEQIPLQEVIARRLTRLPADATSLLETIAVGGQAVSVEEAAAVSGQEDHVYSTLTHMRSERLVRLIGTSEQQQVDTYHDKIRETILADLNDEHRRQLHLEFGERIEGNEGYDAEALLRDLRLSDTRDAQQQTGARIFDLAHHFHEANAPRAFAYQLLAGQAALANYAADEAISYFERAQHSLPDTAAPDTRFFLWYSMGRSQFIRRKAADARELFERALEAAATDIDRARAWCEIGATHAQASRYEDAIAAFDECLALLGQPRPKSQIRQLLSFFTDSLIILLSRPKQDSQSRYSTSEIEKHRLYTVVLTTMAKAMLDNHSAGMLYSAARGCRVSYKSGSAGDKLIDTGHLSLSWGTLSMPFVTRRLLRRCTEFAVGLRDPGVRGKYLMHIGWAYYFIGDLDRARSVVEPALPLLRRSGLAYESTYCPHMLRHIAFFTQSAGDERRYGQTVLDSATAIGNAQHACWGTYDVAVAAARAGHLEEAREFMGRALEMLSGERYYMTEAIRGASLGYVLLQCSDYDGARELSGPAWEICKQKMKLLDVTAFALPVLIESTLGPEWHKGIDRSTKRSVRKLAWWARAMFRSLPNHQPHLLRMLGRYDAACGRTKKAQRRFRQSIDLAKKKGMSYPAARALLDLAAVQEEGREENRREAVELLKAMESVIPRAEAWQLGENPDEACVAPEEA
ncbi:Serine/threonine-protein kinase PrkC [Maioricimonas rarisocia]|uniref:Serine/threonine-protein kinase PrkC n=1 Tax=Maioricimonas rarisocia TaxID=2528026 RepID=A0A517ZAQ6_9PLAN|nr:serine/threonine-protein kinase [Maioricimonas rarisocia]QDU39574.1 Serine/threonine-protein kinase PrkC [Maioricimonas rarisocia]